MDPATCPQPAELQAFHDGALARGERVEQLAEHLESCPKCLSFLEECTRQSSLGLTSGGASSDVKSHLTLANFLDEPQLHTALERIADIPRQVESLDPPTRIGEYEILERLGAGGMGTVYKSWHPRLQRPVVLKLIRARVSHHPLAIEQFREEMSALGQLDHPLIVKAYDAQECQGREYLVMEYVAGGNLRDRVRRDGPFSIDDACAIGREMALGLEHLHERRLVHRDIKPSNIVLSDDGRVKILDLGLALSLATASSETNTGPEVDNTRDNTRHDSRQDPRDNLEGTPEFMAPEQLLHSRNVTPAADLYALGATLYFLLVGESPWAHARQCDARLEATRNNLQPDFQRLPKRLPRGVRRCVERLLSNNPADRPASAHEVAELLEPHARRSRQVAISHGIRASSARVPNFTWLATSAMLVLCLAAIIPLVREWIVVEPSPRATTSTNSADSTTTASSTTPATPSPAPPEPSPSSEDLPSRPRFTDWRPGSSKNQLVGLARFPPLFKNFTRWQVETIRPRGQVQAMALSPDGRHVALTSQDGAVRVFERRDMDTPATLVRLLPDEAPENTEARTLAWSPDGTRIAVASASRDRPITVWDWSRSTRVLELRGHSEGIAALEWSPNGQWLASADGGGRVRLWDAAGLVQQTIETGESPCRCLAWHPSSESFVVGSESAELSRWTTRGEAIGPRVPLAGGPVLGVAWHPDGSDLAAVTFDHMLHVITPGSDTPLRQSLRVHNPFRALAWHGPEPTLQVVTDDGILTMAPSRRDLQEFNVLRHPGTAWVAGAWSNASQSLLLATADGHVREIPDSGPARDVLNFPHVYIRDLAWNRTSTRLAVCSVDGCIQLWGGQGRPYGTLRARQPVAVGIRCAAWSGDGRYLAAAELPGTRPDGMGRVHVWDTESLEEVATWNIAPERGASERVAVESLAWSDDGRWIVAVGEQGLVATWNFIARQPGPSPRLHTARVNSVANCPHTRRFASADMEGTIQVWEFDDDDAIQRIATWPGQREPAWNVAWNSAGDRLAATGAGQHAWLLDAKTGQELWSFGCPIPPGRVMWNRDGLRLYVNGGGERSAVDGSLIKSSLFLEPAVYSPDGELLASISPAQSVTVHHPRSPIPRWHGIAVGPDAHITFAPSGQINYQTHPFNESLVYVVETRRGEYETLSPLEFERRIERRISK